MSSQRCHATGTTGYCRSYHILWYTRAVFINTSDFVDKSAETRPERFQILALDGGGIKGIFAAAVLAAIEEDLGTSVVQHFDLIAGTSTGGIIALGLGLGLTPRQILDFYIDEGPLIFADRFRTRGIRQLLSTKFSSAALVAALQRRFGNKRFRESLKRLVIPAYNLGEDDVYIFRTAHHDRLKHDYKVPAWQVALSTSAAPTFFPCAREVDKLRLIDGGVWANNPSMVAIVEAQGTLDVPLSAIRLLEHRDFRSGGEPHISARYPGGFWQWRKASIDVILRGQTLGAINQSRFLLGSEHFARINPNVADGVFTLDGVRKSDELIAKAAHHSRREMPDVQSRFMEHNAPAFTPLFL